MDTVPLLLAPAPSNEIKAILEHVLCVCFSYITPNVQNTGILVPHMCQERRRQDVTLSTRSSCEYK